MDRQDDAAQSREFVARLARRFNDPAGVIDVRYARQKYSRIVAWLAERFGLLDQLRERYGADEGIAGDWQTLAMQQSAGEQINLFSTSIQPLFPATATQPFGDDRALLSEASSSLAGMPTSRSTGSANDSLSAPEPKYRISRRRQPIPSSLAMTPSEHHSQSASPTASESDPQKAVEPNKQSSDVPRAIEVPFTTDTPAPFVFSEPQTERADKSQTNAQTRFELREASADRSSASGNTAPEVFASPTAPSIAPLPPASPRGEQLGPRDSSLPTARPRGEHSLRRDTSLTLPRPRDEASEHTRDSSFPLASPLAQLQRADDHQQTGARRSTESAPPGQGTNEIAVASEVRDVHNGALNRAIPEIVWRKSAEPQAMTYSASERGPRVTDSARQVNNSADSVIAQQMTTNRELESVQPRDESRGDEIRIEQLSPQVIRTISERVIRTISLDLKVERERRGISKWR